MREAVSQVWVDRGGGFAIFWFNEINVGGFVIFGLKETMILFSYGMVYMLLNSISILCMQFYFIALFFFLLIVNYSVIIYTRIRREVANVPEKFLYDIGH